MSTKTTLKRIALVAVSALGFGLLSVAPSSATSSTTTADAITVATPTQTVLLSGGAVSSTFSISTTAAMTSGQTVNLRATLSKPTASAINNSTTTWIGIGDATAFTGAVTNSSTTSIETFKLTAGGNVAADASTLAGTLSFTPDVPGTYTITLAATTAAADADLVPGGAAATMTVVVRSLAYAVGDAAAAAPYEVGTGVAGVANTVTVTGLTSGAANTRALVTVSGAGATISSTTGDTATVAADYLSAIISASGAAATPRTTNIVVKTPTVGTVTVSLFNETGANTGLFSATAANTVTITVNAAALNGVYASNSVYAVAGQTTTNGDMTAATTDTFDSTPKVYTASASAVAKASFLVTQYDSSATPLTSAATRSVTIETTLGSVGTSAGVPSGAYAAVAALSANDQKLYLFSDGRSGKGVVTIKVNGVTAKTFDVTFVSTTIAKLTMVPFRPVIGGNGTSSAGSGGASAGPVDDTNKYFKSSWQFILNALDANDNPNQSTTAPAVTIVSSDPSCATAALGSSYSDVFGGWAVTGTAVSASPCKTTITVRNTSTGLISVTGEIRVASTVITDLAMALDKAEYEPGEKVTLTLTAKAADGQAPADGTYYNLFTGALTSTQVLTSYPFTGSLNPAGSASASYLDPGDVTFTGGKATATFYAPSNNWTMMGTTSATSTRLSYNMQGLALSAKATVKASAAQQASIDAANAASDAAAEAIDAANAATDAANLAAEAADAATVAAEEARDAADAATAAVEELATQVATLMAALKAQITTLANTVAKIAKKVKA